MENVKKVFFLFLWCTFITGIAYPLLITLLAQFMMNHHANGSFIYHQDKVIGSELIAQSFTSDRYFWPRPSAVDFNPMPSGGSNLGPISAKLKKIIMDRKEHIAVSHQKAPSSIPSELLFASGSGLDPHISPSTAYFQIDRVAKARGIETNEEKRTLKNLIRKHTQERKMGFIGKPCVNVLLLNKSLDELYHSKENKNESGKSA
jgi:K+-transporting ATPase ATPase C chain